MGRMQYRHRVVSEAIAPRRSERACRALLSCWFLGQVDMGRPRAWVSVRARPAATAKANGKHDEAHRRSIGEP